MSDYSLIWNTEDLMASIAQDKRGTQKKIFFLFLHGNLYFGHSLEVSW